MWLKNIKGNKAQVTYTTLFILIITCVVVYYTLNFHGDMMGYFIFLEFHH